MREILGNRFYIADECEIDDKTSRLINELTNDKYSSYTILTKLRYWLEETKNYRRSIAVKRCGSVPDDVVYECPSELPEGLLDYVRDEIIGRDKTLIYDRGNVRGICSCCGERVKAVAPVRFIQGTTVLCPNCYEPVYCVLKNSSLWKADNVVAVQKGKNGAVWFRQWHIVRDNDAKYENTEEWLSECARYYITKGKTVMFRSYFKASSFIGRCEEYKLHGWERSRKFYVYDGMYSFYDVGVREELEGTCLQYADVIGYLIGYQHQNVIMYAAQFARYPVMEFLHKAGYRNIVAEKVRGGNYEYKNAIKWSGKRLKECFSFPLEYLKEYPAENWTLQKVDMINRLWKNVKSEEVYLLLETCATITHLKQALKYTTLSKAVKYLYKQKSDFTIFCDYFEECEKLGIALSDERNLFPKNLITAHNAYSQLVDYKANPEKYESFKKIYKKLKKLTYKTDEFVIRPAASPTELKNEGTALHHCVAGYADRMSKGETAIFFVRKTGEENKAFYTLELRRNQIVQCRTLNNASYESDKEVYTFCNEWLNKKVLIRK